MKRTLFALVMCLLTCTLGPAALAQNARDPLPRPTADSAAATPLFSIDSPVGPIEYDLGRGLTLGDTGLRIGGFTTVELDREDGEPGEIELDGVSFLVSLEPNEYIRAFMELEIGDLFAWETNQKSVDVNATTEFERLYVDLIIGDPFTLRTGKFQTPVGRWNLVPAEPFVWTTEAPVFIGMAFDERTTGTSILGSFHPFGGTLDYWIYGQYIEPLDASEDPQDHSIGGRLQFDRSLDHWSVGSSFLATEVKGRWSYLAGLDAEFSFDRLLVTTELTGQWGSLTERNIWDVYIQGVFEIVPTFNLVARWEWIDASGNRDDTHIGDLGIAWFPKPYIVFKASYRFTDKQTDEARRGVGAALSFIF